MGVQSFAKANYAFTKGMVFLTLRCPQQDQADLVYFVGQARWAN
jgi:hypothetical protein